MKIRNEITRKRYLVPVLAAGLSVSMLAGCGSSGAFEIDYPDAVVTISDNKDGSGLIVNVENPWVETNREGVIAATGINIYAPSEATDIQYSFMNTCDMAQVTYSYNGCDWTFRKQKTDMYIDISGLYYDWVYQDSVMVSGKEGMIYSYVEDADDSGMIDNLFGIQLVNWYDDSTGISYSLSASGKDLNGMDIQVFAENLFAKENEEYIEDEAIDIANNDIEERVGKTSFESYDEIISLLETGEGYAYINVKGHDGDVLAVTTYVYDDHLGHMVTTDCTFYTSKADGKVCADSAISSGGTANPVAIDDEGVVYGVTHTSVIKYCYGNNSLGDNCVMCLGQVYGDKLDENGMPVSVIGSYRTSNSVINDDNLVDVEPSDVEYYDKMFADYINSQPINFTVVE